MNIRIAFFVILISIASSIHARIPEEVLNNMTEISNQCRATDAAFSLFNSPIQQDRPSSLSSLMNFNSDKYVIAALDNFLKIKSNFFVPIFNSFKKTTTHQRKCYDLKKIEEDFSNTFQSFAKNRIKKCNDFNKHIRFNTAYHKANATQPLATSTSSLNPIICTAIVGVAAYIAYKYYSESKKIAADFDEDYDEQPLLTKKNKVKLWWSWSSDKKTIRI